MTTSQSPLRVLKAQADTIAAKLKAVERGEKIADDPRGKLVASPWRNLSSNICAAPATSRIEISRGFASRGRARIARRVFAECSS